MSPLPAESRLFQGLSRKEMEEVARRATAVEVPPGTTLFSEGDPGTWLLVVEEGEVDVRTRWGTVLRTLSRGEILGEVALLGGGPRMATVTSRGHVRAHRIENDAFLELVVSKPDLGQRLAMNLARILAERVRYNYEKLDEAAKAAHAASHGLSSSLTAAMQFALAANRCQSDPILRPLLAEISERHFHRACQIADAEEPPPPDRMLEQVLALHSRRREEIADEARRLSELGRFDEAVEALERLAGEIGADVERIRAALSRR